MEEEVEKKRKSDCGKMFWNQSKIVGGDRKMNELG